MIWLWLAFVATVYAANWLIVHVGPVPVWPWPVLMAPAGVYAAGLSFSIRDGLSELGGRWSVVSAIVAGACLSAVLSGPLALASGLAFLASEMADWAVYTPLRRRGWVRAVVASNLVGMAVDSWLFLWLAGFSLTFVWGMVAGKLWTTVLVVGVYGLLARRSYAALAR